MIAINSRGDYCHGKGGGYAGLNNRAFSRGGAFGFINDNRVAFASGEILTDDGKSWAVCWYDIVTGAIAPILIDGKKTGAFHGFAGGGMAAWQWDGIYSTTGFRVVRGGLLGVGPNAEIGYKPEYQSYGPTMVHELSTKPDGTEDWELTPNHAYDLQLLGGKRAIFGDSKLGLTVVGIPVPKTLPGIFRAPFAYQRGDVWWLAGYADDYGLVTHPFDDPSQGYLIRAQGTSVWAGWRFLENSLVIACASSEGEQPQTATYPGDMTKEIITTLTPLQDLLPRRPHIAVTEWDKVIKAGQKWKSAISVLGTDVQVVIDEKSQLWWRASNISGEDHTGLTRQLTIEGPTPVPPPEPKPMPLNVRFRCQSNIGAHDMLQVFDDTSVLAGVEAFSFYNQNILEDASNAQCGDNVYPNFVNKQAFKKLTDLGIQIHIEGGSLKPHDCNADNGIATMQNVVQRITDAGGVVSEYSMDEPLTANQAPPADGGCHLPLPTVADSVARWINSLRALGPIRARWLEAWPNVSQDDIVTFFQLLNQRGALPDSFCPDVDWKAAKDQKKDVKAFLLKMQQVCAQYGVNFGVFVNWQPTSTAFYPTTDSQHKQNLIAIANTIHGFTGVVPQHVSIASWANRGSSTGPQDIPNNLGVSGLIQTYQDVVQIFDTVVPQPEPTPEVNPMDYKLVDYVVRLKAVKPISDSKVIAVEPDDRSGSMQPDGTWATRNPGTADAYEQAYERQGLLLYEPVTGKRWSVKYVLEP